LEPGHNDTDAGGGGARHTLAGAPTRTPTTSTHYSGIGDVVERTGRKLDDDQFITTKLNWQNQVSSNKEKQKGFWEKVLQSPGFRPFLFMMKGSHFVRMGHSIAKFASTTQSDQELDGKVKERATFYANERNYESILWAQRKQESTFFLCCSSR
jgi:hypothetical protein